VQYLSNKSDYLTGERLLFVELADVAQWLLFGVAVNKPKYFYTLSAGLSVCPLCRNGCRCCSMAVLSAAVRRTVAAQRTRQISWNSVSPAAGEWACLVVL